MNKPKAVLAKGDFILVNKKTYQELGGHQAVKREIVESAALMRLFKKAGYKVKIADSAGLIRVRKFHSLREIIDSYSKLLYYAFLPLKNRLIGLVQVTLILLCLVVPAGALIWRGWSHTLYDNSLLVVCSILEIFILLFSATFFYKRDGFNPWYALGLPLGVLITCFISYKALLATALNKGISWRGRTYE